MSLTRRALLGLIAKTAAATAVVTTVGSTRTEAAAPFRTIKWTRGVGTTAPYDARALEAQVMLASFGYYFGAMDGKWGRRAGNAAAHFQEMNGIPITGYLDADTWWRLHNRPKRKPSGCPPQAFAAARQHRGKYVYNDRGRCEMHCFENGRLLRAMSVRPGGIATNASGYLSLAGHETAQWVNRTIVAKAVRMPLGRFLPLPLCNRTSWNGIPAIHEATGGSHPNDRGHGCINILDHGDAVWFYNWAPVGTPIDYR